MAAGSMLSALVVRPSVPPRCLSSEDERRHLSSSLFKDLHGENLGHVKEVRLPGWAPPTHHTASMAGNSVPFSSSGPPVCVEAARREDISSFSDFSAMA